MPCNDGGVPYPPTPRELRQRKVPAMLCAVLGTMTSEQLEATLQRIDWKEAGVSREDLTTWWKDHQAEDARRKAAERVLAEKAEARLAAAEMLKVLRKASKVITDLTTTHAGFDLLDSEIKAVITKATTITDMKGGD